MTKREAAIFSSLVDAAVAPEPPLPPVAATDALAAFERYLANSPRLNRGGLRLGLHALDRGARLRRGGASLRALSRDQRVAYLQRLERGRGATAVKALRGLAQLCYYGDDGVMRLLGYDAGAVAARGLELRAREDRW